MNATANFQPNKYADISKLINDNKYANDKFITVKKMDHLYVLKYVKNQLTTENINSLGLFRSIIVDEEGNILSFAPPKSLNFDVFSQSNEYDSCYIQHFPEGTMINVFFDKHTDDWEISTRSSIGAKCNFNMDSNITYRYMFLDAMNHTGLEFDHLDKTCCYSFVLQHPKNRIVVPIANPGIILTNKYKIENNQVYNNNDITSIRFSKLTLYAINDESISKSLNYTGSSWNEIIEHFFSSNLPYQLQGIVLYNINNIVTPDILQYKIKVHDYKNLYDINFSFIEPYSQKVYLINFQFTDQYPFRKPNIKLLIDKDDIIINPNIYPDNIFGNVEFINIKFINTTNIT